MNVGRFVYGCGKGLLLFGCHWPTAKKAVQVGDQVARVPDLLGLEELLVGAGLV
ncbi:hypothetical protein ACVWYU_000534 [Pseudomonas sp. TE12234]|jgi:hypothetical protein